MAYFISAKQARDKARKDSTIQSETAVIEGKILTAVEANTLTISIDDQTVMTESTDSSGKAVAETYYNVWQGSATDATKADQMAQVIKYFVDLGYSIHRQVNTSTNTTFKWEVSW
jgi:hypothetical protein|tara:strand:+ start:586 stop:930 length:345 start_codon:yes stop_codon:yes gene_type:complete